VDRESSQPAATADSNHRQLNICCTSSQLNGFLEDGEAIDCMALEQAYEM